MAEHCGDALHDLVDAMRERGGTIVLPPGTWEVRGPVDIGKVTLSGSTGTTLHSEGITARPER